MRVSRTAAFALMLVTVHSLRVPSAMAQPPSLINYQGRLLQGTNLVSGSVGLTLRLYNVSVGGSILYADSNSVSVVDGLYSTQIGDGTISGNLLLALTNSQVWIEAVVNGTTMTPRERVASAAYSMATRGWRVSTNAQPSLTGIPESNAIDRGNHGSVIAGGVGNVVSGFAYSVISGGMSNRNLGMFSTIGGGSFNAVEFEANHAVVGGGNQNTIGSFADYGAILGGRYNTLQSGAEYGVILGGFSNTAGQAAYAAGFRAQALHIGAVVWSDVSSPSIFASTATNQFLIRASGGLGINTNSPQSTLDVNGSIRVGGGSIFSRMVEGTAVLGPGTNTMSYSVLFPAAFTSSPKVIATPRNDPTFNVVDTFTATIRQITLTNFVVNIQRVDAAAPWAQSLRLDWIAWH